MQRFIASAILFLLLVQGGANLLRLGYIVSTLKSEELNGDHYFFFGLGTLSLIFAVIMAADTYRYVRTNQMITRYF